MGMPLSAPFGEQPRVSPSTKTGGHGVPIPAAYPQAGTRMAQRAATPMKTRLLKLRDCFAWCT